LKSAATLNEIEAISQKPALTTEDTEKKDKGMIAVYFFLCISLFLCGEIA
jgi:hypothetical protein